MWLTPESSWRHSGAIPATSQKKLLASLHFIDKGWEGETQRGRVTCPKANMSKGTQLEIFKPSYSLFPIPFLFPQKNTKKQKQKLQVPLLQFDPLINMKSINLHKGVSRESFPRMPTFLEVL